MLATVLAVGLAVLTIAPAERAMADTPSAALAYWPLDDINGRNFTDQVSGEALSTTAGVSWIADAHYIGAKAANFDGVTGAGTATVAGLDTSRSFSVASWVRPTALTGQDMTALGEDGTKAGGFHLGIRCTGKPSVPHWAFTLNDTRSSTSRSVSATGPALTAADIGRWVFLAGVFDAAQKTVSVYLNGVLVGTAARNATGWTAGGPFSIGRGFDRGRPAEWYRGQIADVRVWNRVISTEDFFGNPGDPANGVPSTAGLMSPTQVANWSFADVWNCFCGGPSLSTAFSGQGMFLDPGWFNTPPTSAFVSDSHDGNGALLTDGMAGYASTTDPDDGIARPVLRTEQTLTVSAWVRLAGLTGGDQVAVGQGGAIKLGVDGPSGAWCFATSSPDGAGGYAWTSACSATAATPGSWTQLVGVFDAYTGQIRLYVNGALATTTTGATGWYSTGSLMLGSAGGTGDFFGGTIDQVKVWQGALSDREVGDLYRNGNA